MTKRWLDTGYLAAQPQGVISEKGIIRGVKVCSEGEAKGHGVRLDSEFIDTLVAQGNEAKRGLKARFGHPNMCSTALGTFLGRFKNFSRDTTLRDDGSAAECCFADLFLSDSARDTPNGDLHSYVLSMAENEADMLGTSIVFNPGPRYRRNGDGEKVFPRDQDGNRNDDYRQAPGPDFIECAKLLACDCVDDPAANDGLFSAFGSETIAGQITEFLDLNPQIFGLLEDNPEVMEAISQYGDNFDEFFKRYKAYREKSLPPSGDNKTMEVNNMEKETKLDVPEAEDTAASNEAGKEQGELTQKKTPPVEAEVLESADVETQVEAALQKDRKRSAEIRSIGRKFGFDDEAEQFAEEGKSVDEFREHLLDISPDKWRSTLSVKNPTQQLSEQQLEDQGKGAEIVDQIKKMRAERFAA